MDSAPGDAELLRVFLAERDTPCPRCGYNLRALTSQRCPECGEELKLSVGLVYPRLAAAITGLIGLAAGAGLNGLLLVFLLTMLLNDSPIGHDWRPWIRLGAAFAVHGGLITLWLVFWRRICQLSGSRRWLLATFACLLALVNVVWLYYLDR